MINNTDGGAHPFHLHGHSIWIIGTNLEPDAEVRFKDNYVICDVVSVPAMGWAKIRFISDNPGVWLFHCHIGWHMKAGLIAKFIEAPTQLREKFKTGEISLPPDHLPACGKPDTSCSNPTISKLAIGRLNMKSPSAIAVDATGDVLYVADDGDNSVKSIQLKTGSVAMLGGVV